MSKNHNLVSDTDIVDLEYDELCNEVEKFSATEKSDIFKHILDLRKFEIENFWKRTLFFWGTLTILIVGYLGMGSDETKELAQYKVFVVYLGVFYNFIFSLSLRGSKYWQENWEHIATEYEKQLNIKLFRWRPDRQRITHNKDTFPLLRAYRFSVSKLTMILSDITLAFWLVLTLVELNALYNKLLLHFDFSFHNEVDYFTLFVILFPCVFSLYIILLLRYKTIRNYCIKKKIWLSSIMKKLQTSKISDI